MWTHHLLPWEQGSWWKHLPPRALSLLETECLPEPSSWDWRAYDYNQQEEASCLWCGFSELPRKVPVSVLQNVRSRTIRK